MNGARLPARWKTPLTKGVINTLDRLGLFSMLGRDWEGVGVILTLHHVKSRAPGRFSPNRILSISPEYLRSVIRLAREMGNDIVTLTEACRRLREGDVEGRFVCLTLDDGYRDNLTDALPVFESEQAPFTLYVATAMPEGTALLWWDLLEQLIAESTELSLPTATGETRFRVGTVAEKYSAYDRTYAYLRSLGYHDQRLTVRALCEKYNVDSDAYTREQSLSWDDIQALASHPLCEIGAHTVNHPALSRLTLEEARREITESRECLESRLGLEIQHFAYPYGDSSSASAREFELLGQLGFESSVTTHKGVIFPEHAEHMQALPRVSLNGDYQNCRYTRLFLQGKPFVVSNRFRKVNVSQYPAVSMKS